MSEDARVRAPLQSWLGLIATLGPVLVVAMDGSILFLAMPSINEAIQPTTEQSLWILDIYGFTVGSLLVTFGNLGDRFGRKKLLLIGASAFGVGSTCSAFASSPEILIGTRALMGLGGATLLPSCLAVISELFSDAVRRARAIGVFAATFSAGFVIGPIVGGVMLNRFWWGSVFLINVPVIVVFLCLAPILLKEVHGSRPGRIDILSIVLSATGLLLAIYGVKHAATYGVDRLNVTLVMVGIIILVIFFVWSAAAYLSMTYLQFVLGYTVLHAAVLAIPGAIVLTLSSVFTPHFVEYAGARAALILCHFSMAAGMLLLLLTSTATGPIFYMTSTVVAGIGFGISFSLVADTAVGAVPESRAGAAGAIAETSNEIGNALGIALLGSLLTVVFRATYDGTETGIGEVVEASGVGSAAFDHAQSAFLNGFHAVGAVAAIICGSLGILAIRWIPHEARQE